MSRTARPVTDAVGDTVSAVVAVLSVSAAVARLLAEGAERVARTALTRRGHVPVVRPALSRTMHTGADQVRAVAYRRLGPLADALLPRTAAAVLSRLDVAALVERYVDVQRIAGGLDVDAVAAQLDIARVIDRVDIDAIAAGLDLNTLVEKVDIARVIDRVDLDEIVARVDIERVIDRLDLDQIVARVDIDPVIERANIVEIARYVVQELDLPALIRSSTTSVSTDVVRSVRDQGVDADRAVERVVDRLLLRRHGRRDGYPAEGT